MATFTDADSPRDAGSPRSLARRYFEMWNTGDTAAAAQILSATWTDHSHPEVSSPIDVESAVAKTRAARPQLRFEIDTILAEGDRVCVVGGVGAPDHPGEIASRLIWLFQVGDGRLTELRTYRAV